MLVYAYAKINLTLDITGRNPDGYHLLDSVFQSVALFDAVTVEKGGEVSVLCDGINGKDNIAFTAAKKFFEFTGVTGGADIVIKKSIPLLSGLGGGSADAAAVIIALDSIYKTNLDKKSFGKIALSCGADVPFCLFGGTARIGGIGEKITALPDIDGFWATVIIAGEKKSTRLMYEKLDKMPPVKPFTGEFLELLSRDTYSAFSAMGNAFGAVAGNSEVISLLAASGALGASVSGSGPAHFAVFADKKSAVAAAKKAEKQGLLSYAAPFVNRGNEIIE